MKYVYNGCPEDEARLCFVGHTNPIYKMSPADTIRLIEPEKPDERLSMSIKDLVFSNRAQNAMLRAGINTVGELIDMTVEQFAKTRGIGVIVVNEVIEVLNKHGLSFKVVEEAPKQRKPRARSNTRLVVSPDGSYVIERIKEPKDEQ